MKNIISLVAISLVFFITSCDNSDELNSEINRLKSNLENSKSMNKNQAETISKLKESLKSKMTFEQCKNLHDNRFPSNQTSLRDLLIGLEVLAEHNYGSERLKSPPMLIRVVSTHGLEESCIHSVKYCKPKWLYVTISDLGIEPHTALFTFKGGIDWEFESWDFKETKNSYFRIYLKRTIVEQDKKSKQRVKIDYFYDSSTMKLSVVQ